MSPQQAQFNSPEVLFECPAHRARKKNAAIGERIAAS
jgi:hypothetical protein